MTTIQTNLQRVLNELDGSNTRLVAVSKYHPAEAISQAYECGQRIFGESHVQELCAKHENLPADIEWHFIGHLQTNKVKYMAPFITLIHSVDSMRLLHEIDRQAMRCNRTIDCLLQVHVAKEETKFGFTPDELLQALDEGEWKTMAHTRICGLMGMATNTDDTEQIRSEFHTLRQLFDTIHANHMPQPTFRELSMGMSHDYEIAMSEGSTLVRIGSSIFGDRKY